MFRFKKFALAMAALVVLSSNPVRADDPQVFYVLNAEDYGRLTGCDGFGHSMSGLTSAIQFLVFSDSPTINDNNRSIQYARRHTRPFLGQLLASNKAADGSLDARCLPPSLRQIALALKMLNESGRYTHHGEIRIDEKYSAEASKNGTPSADAYPIMKRISYIKSTGCKVSPSSFDKFRLAFEELVLWQQDRGSAKPHIIAFLEDLFDSRPTPDGYVDQSCMVDMISRIAADLGVLDDKGRYKSRR